MSTQSENINELAQAVAAVMLGVSSVAKTGRNSYHGYD